jgi:hypothetical protein
MPRSRIRAIQVAREEFRPRGNRSGHRSTDRRTPPGQTREGFAIFVVGTGAGDRPRYHKVGARQELRGTESASVFAGRAPSPGEPSGEPSFRPTGGLLPCKQAVSDRFRPSPSIRVSGDMENWTPLLPHPAMLPTGQTMRYEGMSVERHVGLHRRTSYPDGDREAEAGAAGEQPAEE